MNKKSFLLIFVFTLTMFFIHYWFIGDKGQKATTGPVVESEQVQEDVSHRKAKISDLPFVEFFSDQEASIEIGFGIQFDNSYLIYPNSKKDETFPSELYVKPLGLPHSPILVKRVEGSSNFDTPSIYSASKNPKITGIYPPQVGNVDVQLAYFNENTSSVNIAVATFENDTLHFIEGPLNERAIVLMKDGYNYYPVGFYQPGSDKVLFLNQVPKFASITSIKTPKKEVPSVTDETFYVIENEYQQVVFSNFGGAIAEINLPFKSKQNTNSVVLPIGFDKKIEKNSPKNARFPFSHYYTADSKSIQEPQIGGYYPLLRRDLKYTGSKTTFVTPPRYYALNVVSEEEPELAKAIYKVKRFENNLIEFELTQSHRKITKTYYFAKNNQSNIPYSIQLDVKVQGDSRGLSMTSGVPEVELISGSSTPELKYRYSRNQKTTVDKLKLPKNVSTVKGITPDWVSNTNGFFGIILDPKTEVQSGFDAEYIPGKSDPTRLTLVDAKHDVYPASKYPGYMTLLPIKAGSKTSTFVAYAGPLDQEVLKAVDSAFSNSATKYNPKYVDAISFHGWFSFISEPFAKFLLVLMKFFYGFTHSWGFCIILITIVLRILLYPLNSWSIKSMTKMQMLAPEIDKIKKKFKDPKRVQMETMQLYKEKKVNPFSGCLPMLIQMPFLIGMFDLLKSAFPLRGTPFIPGWINDLAAPDVLFSWSYPIFFFGTEFHLLPFILGGMMFIQQKMSATANKNNPMGTSNKQNVISGNIMTIFFTLLFYNFPSGLNIYWISSTVLGILQQWVTSNQMKKKKQLPKKA